MRRNRRNNAKKERIIMLASSAFVLTALTMTGIYMQTREEESKDDGYTLDFTALEDNAEDKYLEIAQNRVQENEDLTVGDKVTASDVPEIDGLEDDLDYMPMEVGSGYVEIPGLTIPSETENLPADETKNPPVEERLTPPAGELENSGEQEAPQETESSEEVAGSAQNVTVMKELHFAESDGLLRPLEGEVLIPFSMDGGVYFSTLDHYKYNPALMIVAKEDMAVAACAEGEVIDIFEDAVIGHAVTMDLGDGYQLTYGQLKEVNVSENSYVNPGELIGTVAAPTKYFSVEGANLYLKLTMDGKPVNPEALFR